MLTAPLRLYYLWSYGCFFSLDISVAAFLMFVTVNDIYKCHTNIAHKQAQEKESL